MKKRKKKTGGVEKGLSSGILLSLLLHVAAFLLAGMLVVFTVVNKEPQKFEQPKPVVRPKMKLKKPKVNIKKSSKPKSTTRIVTMNQKANMPDIQLPEMGGIGDGLGDGLGGGFDMIPSLEEVTTFGGVQSIGNDLIGTFYDLKRDRNARPIIYSQDKFLYEIKEFIRRGFNPSQLAKYYQSPKKLYTTTIMMPPMLSCMAPMAFGEDDTAGVLFLVHYTGQLTHKDGITFRFRGSSGDCLMVGLDGKVVLNACWIGWEDRYYPGWQSTDADHRKHRLGFQPAAVGDWITLEPGESRKIDILVAETPGGGFSAQLVVEEKDVEYEHNNFGAPILPAFKTAELSLDQMDAIYSYLVEGEVCLTNGPVFCDYDTMKARSSAPSASQKAPPEPEPDEKTMRIWTTSAGKSIEAEFVTTISDTAVLKTATGKQLKIPMEQLCEEDRMFIELNSPPEFELDFAKQTRNRPPIDPGTLIQWRPPTLIDYIFTAKIKQTSPGVYNHELGVEYFAIGQEVDGGNYILLDRKSDTFTPTKQNKRSHAFSGDPVLCYAYDDLYSDRRGSKYGGYLITITDSRGKIIATGSSHKWLVDILEPLKRLPVGKHFDKSGTRVFPPRPKLKY